MRKKRTPTITLPFWFWDNEKWVTAETYKGFTVYSDKILAEILRVSPVRVSTWRYSKIIPSKMMGNFAVYDVNAVLKALQAAGYKVDPNKQSRK